ncbi:hypothetical protein [Paenibacillus apiarius]|uniref:Uncharacterized protein n=1 Tax=Paenibacillus apiarius TaxID=46240 RepID=A0ABT4DRA9_9BACL|nr:hypothetical protein [Paenibacillus apiarius]MCY9514576.1 hypothetical protein [Paenibacillus apiarius]MCY9518566.1 hypothetical protein [Paenibacillus apiarius]MCY9552654.1 hypothetical protein [Paenibacillus apiarius]MCY9557018.1 hypothetical protein [Paenibacillus apiarius]MCY9686029.1 hypothetical protein [Paenibacillus apiarius]
MKRPEITIVGCGNVESAVAYLTVLKQLGDAVLYEGLLLPAEHRGLMKSAEDVRNMFYQT